MLKISLRIMFILCIFLLIVNIFAFEIYGTASEPVRFSTILKKMDNVKPINLSLEQSISFFKLNDKWDILDGIRQFINYIGQVIGFLVYIIAMIINMLSSIVYLAYLLGLSSFSAISV